MRRTRLRDEFKICERIKTIAKPVTPQSVALTGDLANNSKVHWELAQVYVATGQNNLAKSELNSYLQATQWHSDVYPWRIALAKSQIVTLKAPMK